MQKTLYPKPISHKKVLYYLFYILGWLGVIIGIFDLYIGFTKKELSLNTLAGFLWAGGFFILSILLKKWKNK